MVNPHAIMANFQILRAKGKDVLAVNILHLLTTRFVMPVGNFLVQTIPMKAAPIVRSRGGIAQAAARPPAVAVGTEAGTLLPKIVPVNLKAPATAGAFALVGEGW